MLSVFTLESEIFIVLCFILYYFPTVIYYVIYYVFIIENDDPIAIETSIASILY